MSDVRSATSKDLPSIFALYDRWRGEGVTIGLGAAEPGYFETRLGLYFFVAEADGDVVGFACGSIHTTEAEHAVVPAGAKYLEIDELYVVPEHRNRGIGSELLRRLGEHAEGAGAQRTLVYSAVKDWRGVAEFYERQGFGMWFIRMVR